MTFSKSFGFVDAGKDDGSFAQIDIATRSAAWIGQIPILYWIHDLLSPVIGNHLGIATRHGKLRTFASQEVENRKTHGSSREDIVHKLFRVQKEKPEEMNDSNLLSMTTTNVFAGSDTTAISTRAVIYYLLKSPECKRRLIDEIDTKWADGKLTEPITFNQAEEMPYLQACIWEGLRCHPAVGMNLPRVTPQGGIQVGGQHIPKGVSRSNSLILSTDDLVDDHWGKSMGNPPE
ncbi:hypothetical protein ACLMJK_003573 [Lecanora helva]